MTSLRRRILHFLHCSLFACTHPKRSCGLILTALCGLIVAASHSQPYAAVLLFANGESLEQEVHDNRYRPLAHYARTPSIQREWKKLYTFAVDTFLALAASFGQRDADLRIQHRLLHLSSWANGWSSISGRSYSPNACVRVPERQNSGPICVCKSPEPKLPMRRVQQPEIRS